MNQTETTLHEILEALHAAPEGAQDAPLQASCALCRLIARSVAQSTRAFFAEFVNDPPARTRLRQARGFCAEHTALLASLGDALAVAILYSDLARLTRERWQQEGGRGLRLNLRGGGRTPSTPCPACADAQEAQARYVGALVAGLKEPQVWEALEAGSGLCVAHAERVMAQAAPAHAARLRLLESERLAALQADLDEIVRKNDYRFRGEAWGPERDAWLRALKKLSRP